MPPGRKRRPDEGVEVVLARPVEQHGLDERSGVARLPGQEHAADGLGGRRAAGLARNRDVAAAPGERIGEATRLGGLAGALPALERDEPAPQKRLMTISATASQARRGSEPRPTLSPA